ncbi:MAG TPA: class I SAM-dependent methyltransferase [Myxococcota bacterium]|nr:class I SAM-dependent methyltransferase [Myxococcota bacterium]
MSSTQSWDPERYARNARFVSDLGQPVLELLAAQPGERVLDLGCGDGVLAEKLVALGTRVVGVDGSAPQVAAARGRGIDAHVMDGQALAFEREFDAVFSNAALHWMRESDLVIRGVARALRPGGRFVGEFGGHGCVAKIVAAVEAALGRRGIDAARLNPWYFPTAAEYAARLAVGGFEVRYIALIPRPTPLPGEIRAWLETFCESFTAALAPADRPALLDEVSAALRPELCDREGRWSADYVRLRFSAWLPVSLTPHP